MIHEVKTQPDPMRDRKRRQKKKDIKADTSYHITNCEKKEHQPWGMIFLLQPRHSQPCNCRCCHCTIWPWSRDSRCGGIHPSSWLTSIVRHVGPDKVPSSQCRAERELSSQYGRGNDPSEHPCIITRVCWMSATDSKEVEHGTLRLEDGATADCTNFDGRHRNRDL